MIRPVDPVKDLSAIADLIEICFLDHLDTDGHEYVRFLRNTALSNQTLGWIPFLNNFVYTPFEGFVWQEGGKIVGNLSLIPHRQSNTLKYLIANVTVLPDYRGKGIATKLTEFAVQHLQKKKIPSVWLQVREDNTIAQRLYTQLGFFEIARRVTWQLRTGRNYHALTPPNNLLVRKRVDDDWKLQSRWLSVNYPPALTWNLALNLQSVQPGSWNCMLNLVRGEVIDHWSILQNNHLMGVATLEATLGAYDLLWLAAPSETEDRVIRILLPRIFHQNNNRRIYSLNYPYARGENALESIGFRKHLTLIWMELNIL